GEGGEVDDRVEPLQLPHLDVPHIDPHLRDVVDARDERAPLEEVGVETDDVVTGAEQHRDHHRADVSLVAADEDAHGPTGRPFGSRTPRRSAPSTRSRAAAGATRTRPG